MRGVGEDLKPPVGPVDALEVPRFAGPTTFARLPTLDAVGRAAVAIVGVPFDSGVVYGRSRALARRRAAPGRS